MLMRWSLVALFAIGALLGCAGKNTAKVVVLPDPELTFLGRSFDSGLCQVTLKLRFNLKNTRAQTLELSHFEANTTYAGVALEAQRKTLEGEVLTQSEQELIIPVVVKRSCDKLVDTPQLDTLEVSGRIHARAGGEVVFEFEDKMDLAAPKQPELAIEMIGQRYDDERVEIIAQLKIKNSNPFAIMLEGGHYSVRLSSIAAAEGEAWPDQRIPENSEVRYDVPIKIVPGETTPLSVLQKERRLTFEVDTTVKILGAPDLKFRKTGVVSF